MSAYNFHTASVYAKAVIMLNLPKEKLEQITSELLAVASYNINILSLNKLLEIPFLEETKSFLKVIFNQNKVQLLPQIAQLLKLARLEKEKIILVKITSATELSKQEEEKIIQLLSSKYKKEILLEKQVNASLISGFTLQFGAFFIDFSKKEKISKIKSCILK